MHQEQKIEALFKKAQSAPVVVPFSESKRSFMENTQVSAIQSKGKRSFGHLKNILIMIGIVSILSLIISISISSNETPDGIPQKTHAQQGKPTNDPSLEVSLPSTNPTTETRPHPINPVWENLLQPLPVKEIFHQQNRKRVEGNFLWVTPQEFVPAVEETIPFPKLTEEEISANHKQKKKMIKALSKLDSKEYAYVPSSSYLYNGVPVSVQAFYIQRKEVTNLEYRTFLFDLLIQDRKEEFLRAAPNQTFWTSLLADSLIDFQNNYFSDHQYNDFPVVNVSKEGAEMYCRWITTETNKTRKSDFINDVRIPQILEWSLAASNLGKQSTYPWDNENLINNEAFNANFNLKEYNGPLEEIKQKTHIGHSARTTFEYTNGLMIASVKTYEPNQLGLYNMSGNVAEIVSTDMLPDSFDFQPLDNDQIVTCGGSWMSASDELKVYNSHISNNINGHPSIGFRVVITYLAN